VSEMPILRQTICIRLAGTSEESPQCSSEALGYRMELIRAFSDTWEAVKATSQSKSCSDNHSNLCSFGVNLGFEGLLAGNIDLDLLGFGFRLLGEFDLQHALFIVGAHLPCIH